MGAERTMRRRQQRQAPTTPPPTAGAVDLGKLKGGDSLKQRQALRQVLTQNGFVCTCGQRFEDRAIMAFGAYSGVMEEPEMQQTPVGPMPTGRLLRRDGATLAMRAFCSRACPDYLSVLKDGMDRGEGEAPAHVIALRPLPATEWLSDVPEHEDVPEDICDFTPDAELRGEEVTE